MGAKKWMLGAAQRAAMGLSLFLCPSAPADTYKIPTSTYNFVMGHPTRDCKEVFRSLFRIADVRPLGESQDIDNQRFIDSMKLAEAPRLVYLHVTLKVLKPLNDRVFADESQHGKEDVNSARNLYRTLFIENLESDKELYAALGAQGRDRLGSRFISFNTMELAFDPTVFEGGQENMIRRLNGVLVKSGLQFETAMLKIHGSDSIMVANMMKEHGLVGDLQAWHLAGVAVGNPDHAAFAARQKAATYNPQKVFSMNAMEFSEADAANTVAKAEVDLKPALIASLGEHSDVFSQVNGTRPTVGKPAPTYTILSKASIDILRKVNASSKEEYIAAVTAEFKTRLKVNLTPEQVLGLRDYFATADKLNPPIRAAKREQIDLSAAKYGKVGVDFAGQNVENMFQTMAALAEAHAISMAAKADPRAEPIPVGRTAISLAREGEARATARLNRLKNNFERAFLRAGIKGFVKFSGDDGELILSEPLTTEKWTSLHERLLAMEEPISDYRITAMPPLFTKENTLDTGKMSRESVKAEDFEKKLRGALYAKIPAARLKQLGISTRLTPGTKTTTITLTGDWTKAERDLARETMAQSGITPEGYTLTILDSVLGAPPKP